MKSKRIACIAMAGLMAASLAGCGGSDSDNKDKTEATKATTEAAGSDSADDTTADAEGIKSYADIQLGTDFTDLSAEIKFYNNRTDMDSDDYGGKNWKQYLEDFNKEYPNIKVDVITDTNYADDALTHLQSGNYETVMCIPAVDMADLSTYFMPFGDYDTMSSLVNYSNRWLYQGQVYGVPLTATTQGIVYNKKVFADAGVTDVPKTPEEFIAALKAIKEKNPKCIPLYTNYAAGWTMGAWDDYISITATGDATYKNQKLAHTKDPFKNYGDDTHAYAVYKILYDAVSQGLTEEDYSTTDWESSKGMLNNGEIGCMVLGSWSYPQMEAGEPNADDIGYIPFPISVNGKQYASSGADYCYGINVNASDEEKQAALVFVKWMTEKSGYAYNEDSLALVPGSESKISFDGVEFFADEPALEGEEDYLNQLNSESELNVSNGGNDKIQAIIEHAANGDMSFDDIMAEWNQKWSDAQESLGIDVTEK